MRGSAKDPRSGRVFFDGTFSGPRLDHPECLAVHSDGSIWCGGEAGQIFRIDPLGHGIELIASTNGFVLGVAFGEDSSLYVCDLAHRAVFRLDPRTARLDLFATGVARRPFRIPNFLVFDAAGRLYVSDSNAIGVPGPGIYRFDQDGPGSLWFPRSLNFANGLALAPDGSCLYVVESFRPGISRIAINPDGSAGSRQVYLELPGIVPDGITFGPDGRLYVGCYEPSQILRIEEDGRYTVLLRDPTAHLLCHPTNLAFRGTDLFVANLGRCHITVIDAAAEGV
jgi:gluconolactonase